jgi:dihydroorotate dehydrogenase (NAD+) catalytic subunit
VAEFTGGMLNAVGLANPGLEHVAEIDIPWLEGHLSRARVLVNVVGAVVEDFATVVERLDDCAIVTAFELNLSCPNTAKGGEEFSADTGVLAELVSRCRRAAKKPLVAKLGPLLSDVALAAAVAEEHGVDGFSLVNTVPGALYRVAPDGGRGEPALGFGRGGVSGPALLPAGVLAVSRVRERTGLPIIGMGGIRTLVDVDQYMAAGATLVAVGTAALADPRVPERLARQWERRG